MSDLIHFREGNASDAGFILKSWLTSAGDAWSGKDGLRNTFVTAWPETTRVGWFADVPHRFTRQAVAEILERQATRAIVACDPEDESVIYGFAVGEPDERIVHWCHVKHSLRRNGIARELLTRLVPTWRDGLTCTYVGRGFLGWMAGKAPLRFDPHAGRR